MIRATKSRSIHIYIYTYVHIYIYTYSRPNHMNSEIWKSKGMAPVNFRRFAGGLHSVEKRVAFRTALRFGLGVEMEAQISRKSCFLRSLFEGAFRGANKSFFGGPELQKHRFYCNKTTIFENRPWSDGGRFSVCFGYQNGSKSIKKRFQKIIVFRDRFRITF